MPLKGLKVAFNQLFILRWILVFSLPWLLLCLNKGYEDFRGVARPFVISQDKQSLAVAALYDLRTLQSNSMVEEIETSDVQIMAGVVFNPEDYLELQPLEEPFINLEPIRIAAVDWPILPGMTISSFAKKQPVPQVEYLAEYKSPISPTLYTKSGHLKSVQERSQLLASYYRNEDVTAKTWKNKLNQLLAAYPTDEPSNDEKIIQGEKSLIYIAKPKAARAASAPGRIVTFNENNSEKHSAHDRRNQKRHSDERADRTPVKIASLYETKKEKDRLFEISGLIEMSGGLAYTGINNEVRIRRYYAGKLQDEGYFDYKESAFSIRVSELKGYLVAEYIHEGRLTGEGRINLYTLKNNEKDYRLAGHEIIISPKHLGLMGRMHPANGHRVARVIGKEIQVAELQRSVDVSRSGEFSDGSFTQRSNVVAIAEAKGFEPTVTMLTAGQDAKVEIFTDQEKKALMELAGFRYNKDAPVIWGKVSKGTEPQTGVMVELSDSESAEVIYFDQFIPDKSLQKTTDNGMFAIVGMQPGFYSIRAHMNGQGISQSVLVQQGMNTQVHFHIADPQIVTASVTEVFSDITLSAEVYFHGADDSFSLKSGLNHLVMHRGSEAGVIEVGAGDGYIVTRHNVFPEQTHLQLLAIKLSWLDSIESELGVDYQQARGVFYVQRGNFDNELYINGELAQNKYRVAYLDAKGKIISDSDRSLAEAMLVFNVEPGVYNLSLIHNETNRISSQTMTVAEDIVSVISP